MSAREELSERAQEMYDALTVGGADAARMSLIIEACRTAERLDHLNAIITGKSEWISLMHFRTKPGDDSEIVVTIDNILSEARQQGAALRQMITALEAGRPVEAKPEPKQEVNGLVVLQEELAKRRQSGSSGSRRAPF